MTNIPADFNNINPAKTIKSFFYKFVSILYKYKDVILHIKISVEKLSVFGYFLSDKDDIENVSI